MTAGREGGFGFIEEIDALGRHVVLHGFQHSLAMGSDVVVWLLSIRVGVIERCDIVERFATHVIAPFGAFGRADEGDCLVERGMGVWGGHVVVSGSSFGIEAIGDRHGFNQGGFA